MTNLKLYETKKLLQQGLHQDNLYSIIRNLFGLGREDQSLEFLLIPALALSKLAGSRDGVAIDADETDDELIEIMQELLEYSSQSSLDIVRLYGLLMAVVKLCDSKCTQIS